MVRGYVESKASNEPKPPSRKEHEEGAARAGFVVSQNEEGLTAKDISALMMQRATESDASG